MSTGDLFKTYLKVKLFDLKEQIYVISNFYKNFRFSCIDISLKLFYLFINPYRISKKFLKRKNTPYIHLYGETPLSTFEKIVNECNISPSNSVLELGSGRGRCSFWLSEFVGCKVVAIEWIPIFHKIASFISKLYRSKEIYFHNSDMTTSDLGNPDVIFLYGTCLSDKEIHLLIDKFKVMKNDIKIITISYSLADYNILFRSTKSFSVSFPWGNTICYINIKNSKNHSCEIQND